MAQAVRREGRTAPSGTRQIQDRWELATESEKRHRLRAIEEPRALPTPDGRTVHFGITHETNVHPQAVRQAAPPVTARTAVSVVTMQTNAAI